MKYKVEYWPHIYRRDLKDNPDITFLFGDNILEQGMGGQAKEMRGEPNAVGIPTKKRPTMNEDAFFDDDEFHYNRIVIDKAFENIPWRAKVVVIPKSGLGTGLAKLPEKAPKTYQYLLDKITSITK